MNLSFCFLLWLTGSLIYTVEYFYKLILKIKYDALCASYHVCRRTKINLNPFRRNLWPNFVRIRLVPGNNRRFRNWCIFWRLWICTSIHTGRNPRRKRLYRSYIASITYRRKRKQTRQVNFDTSPKRMKHSRKICTPTTKGISYNSIERSW